MFGVVNLRLLLVVFQSVSSMVSCTFFDISPNFVVILIISFLIVCKRCDSTHSYQHPNLPHIQLLLLLLSHCPCLRPIHHCWSYYTVQYCIRSFKHISYSNWAYLHSMVYAPILLITALSPLSMERVFGADSAPI